MAAMLSYLMEVRV